MYQQPKSRQLSSRSVETLRLEKDELIRFIRERRAYMLEQERLINDVINNGNNAILQLTLESDVLKMEILQLRKQRIHLMAMRDQILFEAVIQQNM